jgi:hypothetical protein
MTNYAKQIALVVSQQQATLTSALKKWIDRRATAVAVSFFEWTLSKRPVQEAIADVFSENTPMCRVIDRVVNDAIDDMDREVDVDDVKGLESTIEDALENLEMNAANIQNLDRAISEIIEEAEIPAGNIQGLGDAIAEALVDNEDLKKQLADAVLKAVVAKFLS